MNVTKSIPEISSESLMLIKVLSAVTVGEIALYQQLSAAIGRNVQKEARGILATARRHMLKEQQAVFEAVRTVGLKRLTDGEIANSGGSILRSINRTTARGLIKLSSVKDFSSLTDHQKIRHNTTTSLLLVFHDISRNKGVQRIETAVATLGKKLEVFETLIAFAATNNK